MGVVFSCLAGACMMLGELISTLFLGLGEVASMLTRGVFGLIVGICDVLAACMCCWQVPFSDRPDRDRYTYTTLLLNNKVNSSLGSSPQMINVQAEKGRKSEQPGSAEGRQETDLIEKRKGTELQAAEEKKEAEAERVSAAQHTCIFPLALDIDVARLLCSFLLPRLPLLPLSSKKCKTQ
jgi:hypothetical protein